MTVRTITHVSQNRKILIKTGKFDDDKIKRMKNVNNRRNANSFFFQDRLKMLSHMF